MKPYKYYIFDQGNVILDINPQLSLDAFTALMNPTAADRVSASDLLGGCDNQFITDYMLGLVSTNQFIDYLMPIMRPDTTRQQIIDAWNALILDIPQQRLQALLKLRSEGNKTYILSNTNEEHVRYIINKCFNNDRHEMERYFDDLFFSCEMHMVKPSRDIFIEVIRKTGMNPNEAIFIDDLQKNLDTAAELGFNTLLAVGNQWLTELF